MEEITSHIVQRIAGQLARELKQDYAKPEQEQLVAAVRRLFQLSRPPVAVRAQ